MAEQNGTSSNATVSTAFGYSIAGEIRLSQTPDVARAYCDRGVRKVTLADTVGSAHPRQERETVFAFKSGYPETQLTMHFHDTRGLGLANVLSAVEAGTDHFDTALGGLGG